MISLDLTEVKSHLVVGHDADNAIIGIYMKAAVAHCQNFMGRTLYLTEGELAADLESPENALVLSDDIKAAAFLLIGHFYENRSQVSELRLVNLPLGFEHLLSSYRFICAGAV